MQKYKTVQDAAGKIFVLLVNAANFPISKDLKEFGLAGRVSDGIKGLTEAGKVSKDPKAILVYFNDKLAPAVIDGSKQLPANNPLGKELIEGFLPGCVKLALADLTVGLIGKPIEGGGVHTAETLGKRIEDLITKASGKEFEATSELVRDLLSIAEHSAETPADDLAVLRVSEVFNIPLNVVTEVVVPENLAEVISENAVPTAEGTPAEELAAELPEDETTEVPSAEVETPATDEPAAVSVENETPADAEPATPEAETETPATEESSLPVASQQLQRVRKLANGMAAVEAMTIFIASEFAEIKKEMEEAEGVAVEPVAPIVRNALPAEAAQ